MKVFNIISFVFLFVFVQGQLTQDTLLDLRDQVENYIQNEFNDDEKQAYYDMLELFDIGTRELTKRGDYESGISQALIVFNNTGILWDLMDAIADHPDRLETVTNWTSTFLEGRNFTIHVGSLISSAVTASSYLNISAIVNTVLKSGLIQSTLDGLLLDEKFRPDLVEIINSFVLSLKNTLKYIFTQVLHKRELTDEYYLKDEVTDDFYLKDDSDSKQDEATDDSFLKQFDSNNTGSLEDFFANSVMSLITSPFVGEITTEVLNALNDTGVFVYTIKRFISTESYLNMTEAFVRTIVKANVIHLDFSGINISKLVQSFFGNPQEVMGVVNQFLSGKIDLSFIGENSGKYFDAVKDIIQQLEDRGLFTELNDYIFKGKSNDSDENESSSGNTSKESSTSNSSKDKNSAASNVSLAKWILSCSLVLSILI